MLLRLGLTPLPPSRFEPPRGLEALMVFTVVLTSGGVFGDSYCCGRGRQDGALASVVVGGSPGRRRGGDLRLERLCARRPEHQHGDPGGQGLRRAARAHGPRRGRHRDAHPCSLLDGQGGPGPRSARVLREAVDAGGRAVHRARRPAPRPRACTRRSATTTASSQPSPKRSGCSTPARSARCATSRPRPTARSCCAPRAARGGRGVPRAAAASTTTPPTRSTC